jgi:hypothetical protein
MNDNNRRYFSPEQKVAILREHLLNRMLFAAYSRANALLTADIGDFDSTAKSSRTAPLG